MLAIYLTAMLRRTRPFLAAVLILGMPVLGNAQAFLSVSIAPPPLPVYVQPAVPGPGYIWSPGYWAYGTVGYYWVPGTWVLPPRVGLLWTPGYWGWRNSAYVWSAGYWGPRVGYYGGVNYGYGYVGAGYVGGYWNNGAFYYNRAVNNVNVTSVHNTYNTVVNTATTSRVSYNGGPRGISVEPTPAEREAMSEHHVEATPLQLQHEQAASGNRAMLASENHGRPGVAATPQAGVFDHPGAVAARGNPAYKTAAESGNARVAHAPGPPGQNKAEAQIHGGHPHPQGQSQAVAPGHTNGPRNGEEPHGEAQRHREG